MQQLYFRIGILERRFRLLAFFYFLRELHIGLGQLASPLMLRLAPGRRAPLAGPPPAAGAGQVTGVQNSILILASTSAESKGLEMKSSAPASIPRMRLSMSE